MNDYIKTFLVVLVGVLATTGVYLLMVKYVFKTTIPTFIVPAVLIAVVLAFIKSITGPKF